MEEIHELCEWNAKSLEQSRLLEDPVNHLQAENHSHVVITSLLPIKRDGEEEGGGGDTKTLKSTLETISY